MTIVTSPHDDADRLVDELEAVNDALDGLRHDASATRADAERARATALLEARSKGYTSREERDAYATLASVDLDALAFLAERRYRDTQNYIRVLQSQLDLARTRIVSNRGINV